MGNWSAEQQEIWRRESLRKNVLAMEEFRLFNDIVTRAFKYRISHAVFNQKTRRWVWNSEENLMEYYNIFGTWKERSMGNVTKT